ncbi:pyridoxamine 5'-phosphate oxidase family protein [Geomonas sp. RF6]|uniref:pyridoxamine 5'-phosphate oxidase family protein n=1 Tax=Geomonas sp. RF6 TaxID=2897342 RepID=UPI001E33A311|nr:pyridoxamine 5'-phosphate oxidase family protein [Geomonas sp. RF6]UFS71909.1 pyridoxamine 5'-phosphate oxidase family protein [Geomonas sp. RF6]
MFPEKALEVLKHPGVVAIATQGEDGPHLVNTWNSYLQFSEEGWMLIPAGYMHETETNISKDNRILLTIGSHEVQGKLGAGTGFLIKGTAEFLYAGASFEQVKARYPWARAALAVKVTSVTQTL